MDNPAAVQTGEPANVLKYSTPYVTSVDQLIKVKRIWEMKSKNTNDDTQTNRNDQQFKLLTS